jgi:hypothetical protein
LIEKAAPMPPPVATGGFGPAPAMDIARTEPQAIRAGDRLDTTRVAELNNLRLALVTFALQLDAFELRAGDGLLKAGIRPGKLQRGNNDWSSIRSRGSKQGA